MARKFATFCLALALLAGVHARDFIPQLHRVLISDDVNTHTTTLCNATAVGSVAACFDQNIPAIGNAALPLYQGELAYPADGTPYGIHITPYSSDTYLISWLSGNFTEGAGQTVPDDSMLPAMAKVSTTPGSAGTTYNGTVIQYLRDFTTLTEYSYLSPHISHVVVTGLTPNTTYYYTVGDGKMMSMEYNFTTVPMGYPLRVGLMADVGQTANSSATMMHMIHNKPQVIIFPADLTYADDHGVSNNITTGTDQRRWDSWMSMFTPLFSTTPALLCAGNHEIESSGINATITPNTTSFSFPTNYPFQSYSARFPVPGTTSNFGNINNNMYYATTVAGKIRLITLNDYIPFYEGTPQHTWFMKEIASVNRTETPWLFVQYHTPIYHTYYTHYKEAECFRSVYEPLFYQYGVDVILNGHVHAYERTHGVYNYTVDTCGPMHITIGDGGNMEGPYRNFVDQVNPNTNKTYCEMLSYNGGGPNENEAKGKQWGPSYQTQAQPANCPTISWQPSYNVDNGPVLVSKNGTNGAVGFCQSSQPKWSAYRDPSFGHAILDIVSDTEAHFAWYRNVDGYMVVADKATLTRDPSCKNYSR